MDKNISIIFAVILLLAGGLIVGKALLHRQNVAAIPTPTCPTGNAVQLTPEVRAYIEQQIPIATQGAAMDSQILQKVAALEAEARTITTAYSKSKEFMEKADQLERKINDFHKSREARLLKGREKYGQAFINEAVEECGVKKITPPKPSPSVATPPQPSTSK